MKSENLMRALRSVKLDELIELLNEFGEVENQEGIFESEKPLFFSPTFVEDISVNFGALSVFIDFYNEIYNPLVSMSLSFEVPTLYLTSEQIDEIAETFAQSSLSLQVVALNSPEDEESTTTILMQDDFELYDTTEDQFQLFVRKLLKSSQAITRKFEQADELASETETVYEGPTLFSLEPSGLESVLKELDSLVGLSPVKSMVKQLVAAQQNQVQRKKVGLKVQQLSPHLVFTGNPGTGKTTVARLVGRIYKELGLLEKGHVVETERAGLIAGYVGQTALKTQAVCEAALGGVLFIDEAYSITSDAGISFGQECIQTLLTFMENDRGGLAVVVAGYPAEMEQFLGSNPGLRSRFDTTIHFPDYSAAELEEIFLGLVTANDYAIGDIAMTKARHALCSLPRKVGFANGRDVRKLFQQITTSQAARCVGKGMETKSQLRQITTADVNPHVPARPKRKPAEVIEEVDWFRFGYV